MLLIVLYLNCIGSMQADSIDIIQFLTTMMREVVSATSAVQRRQYSSTDVFLDGDAYDGCRWTAMLYV